MKSKIYSIDSDSTLLEELATSIRMRKVSQKFLYRWKWAKLYYDVTHNSEIYTKSDNKKNLILELSDFNNFINKNITKKNKKIAFISLWCWNSETETYIYENSDFDDIDYFWVDASKEMLEMSINYLKKIKSTKTFICSDFSTRVFRVELHDLTKKYDEKIFVFFSNTFWNIQHTNIIDILYNLLNKWDKIWLDVRLRKWTNVKDDFDAINIIAKNIEKSEMINWHTREFKNLWMNINNWELKMSSNKEIFINALKCQFSYNFNKKATFSIKWETITILPWESIDLLMIYIYDQDWLINFFDEHWFKLLDKQIKWHRWQFFFEKT